MIAYITKHALTRGIVKADAKRCAEYPSMIDVWYPPSGWKDTIHKPFWHETREDAVRHANELRLKRIVALKKHIEKLENNPIT